MNMFNRILFAVVAVHFLLSIYFFETAYEMAILAAALYFIFGGYALVAVFVFANGYFLYKNKWKMRLEFRWFDYVLVLMPVMGIIYLLTYW